MPAFIDFLLGFAFNLVVAIILIRFIYYPTRRDKNYVFTFLAFNTIIYFVLSFITTVEISVGVGFGLFAILSVLRYRTNPMPIREMTYLFIIAALPVMNSVASNSEVWLELIAANVAILICLFLLEKGVGFKYETSKKIKYERIDLIKPENRALLLKDLQERTGLKITRIVIGQVNFLRDTAEIKIFYEEPADASGIVTHVPELLSTGYADDDD